MGLGGSFSCARQRADFIWRGDGKHISVQDT